LGQGIYGPEYDDRAFEMELGSRVFLITLWREHPGILAHLALKGSGNVLKVRR